jgi:putative DNA primase/helicase
MNTRTPPTDGEIINAFMSSMHAAGFTPRSIELNTNDFVRFDAPGDKPGRRNAYYKVKTGDYPVGWFGDWKTGESHHWQYFDKSTLSSKELRQIQAEQRRLKAEAAIETETRHKERAEDARRKWDSANADVSGHPYLQRKMIDPPKGLRLHIGNDGTQLVVVPMWAFDMNGNPRLWNLQYIAPDGGKMFMKGARIDGTFFSLRGSSERNVILLCEGVATGFTLWRATGLSVMVAFNSGNLAKVARELQEWRPMADVLICADDDATAPPDWDERGRGKPWVNAGQKAADRAAKVLGCKWTSPRFKAGPSRDRTDFNDLEKAESLDEVNRQIWGALAGPVTPGDDGESVEARPPSGDVKDETWRSSIPRTANGHYDGGNVSGVAMFIQHHRLLAGRIAFNQFTRDVEVDGAPMQNYHVIEFRKIMHDDRFKARKVDVLDEMEAEARRNQYDPLTSYLGGLKWDGKRRIDTWLVDYLGCDPANQFYSHVAAKILVGAVARARRPGCKLDTMPVLEGKQGIGKSTAIRYLFGDQFFIDDLGDFHSKDSFQLIQGAWACEIAEMSALAKSEVADVKKFLSKVQDKFRAPYERAPVIVPRRTIFFGSVNPEVGAGYLKDTTGARRFWPIACGDVNLRGILQDRDQLWAEAVQRFDAGEKWYLDDKGALADAEAEQAKRFEFHPWQAVIEDYISGIEDGVMKSEVTINELLTKAVRITPDKQNVQHSRIVGGIMRHMGWEARITRPRGGGKPRQVFVNELGFAVDPVPHNYG